MSEQLAIIASMSGLTKPGAVQRLQDELVKMPQPDIVTKHVFKPGIYERTITIPPWTVLTGAEHKTSYSVRLEKGSIAVNRDDGVVVLNAPCEFNAPAGVQRVGCVFDSEVVWTDIYENADDCQNIATVEARLYVVDEFGLGENRKRIAQDQKDFELFLLQYGMTHKSIGEIVHIEHDLMPMPAGFEVELKNSLIHGQGLFVSRDFAAGEIICPGRLDGKRTPAGRFINHSVKPNATPIKDGDDIHAVALRDLLNGEEVVINYRDSMRVNYGINLPKGAL